MVRAREHSRELMKAFQPLRVFLLLIGQMPFVVKAKDDGTYHFKFKYSSLPAVFFLVQYIIFTTNYLFISASIFMFLIQVREFNQDQKTEVYEEDINKLGNYTKVERNWEKHLIQRYFVLTIIVWSWMTIAVIGSTYILTHGKQYVHYCNYWNRVVQNMDMNVTAKVRAYIMRENYFCLVVIILLTGAAVAPRLDTISGTCDVITNFYFRLLKIKVPKQVAANDHRNVYYYIYKIPGYVTMVYAYLASRANIMQFVFFNKLLINTSRIWNSRLRHGLAEVGEDTTGKDKTLVRLDLRFILKDHFIIVQLFKMTESLFSRTLLAYYFLQVLDVVLEVYHLSTLRYEPGIVDNRSFSQGDLLKLYQYRLNSPKEQADWVFCLQNAVVTILTSVQAIVFCYLTTRVSARAYEEAMGGFQILRRNCYLENCDTKEERNFTHTLIVSFAPNNPLQVTAGGFFAINKTLLPGLLGTIAGYFVAMYAMKPDKGDFWKA